MENYCEPLERVILRLEDFLCRARFASATANSCLAFRLACSLYRRLKTFLSKKNSEYSSLMLSFTALLLSPPRWHRPCTPLWSLRWIFHRFIMTQNQIVLLHYDSLIFRKEHLRGKIQLQVVHFIKHDHFITLSVLLHFQRNFFNQKLSPSNAPSCEIYSINEFIF